MTRHINTTKNNLIYPPETVLRAVANHFGVTVSSLKRVGRIPAQIRRKYISMHLLHKLSGIGCVGVAMWFGCHHSLVVHAEKQIRNAFDINDQSVIIPIKEICKELSK